MTSKHTNPRRTGCLGMETLDGNEWNLKFAVSHRDEIHAAKYIFLLHLSNSNKKKAKHGQTLAP